MEPLRYGLRMDPYLRDLASTPSTRRRSSTVSPWLGGKVLLVVAVVVKVVAVVVEVEVVVCLSTSGGARVRLGPSSRPKRSKTGSVSRGGTIGGSTGGVRWGPRDGPGVAEIALEISGPAASNAGGIGRARAGGLAAGANPLFSRVNSLADSAALSVVGEIGPGCACWPRRFRAETGLDWINFGRGTFWGDGVD